MKRLLLILSILVAAPQANADAATVTVTGHYLRPDGAPATGRVLFELRQVLRDTISGVSYSTQPKRATLDGTGRFSMTLVSTNDPAITPAGGVYHVIEAIDGRPLEDHDFVLPYDAVGGTVDIARLSPSSPSLVYGVSKAQLDAAIAAAVTTAGSGFNVKTYGAIGNGVADDTAAIQAAITAAVAAGGGVVYFPHGTYIVSNVSSNGVIFSITSPNLIFRGEGKKVSLIKSSSFMGAGHKLFAVLSTSKDVFEDLGLTAATPSNSSTGLYFDNSVDCTAKRVWVDAQFGWSMQVYNNSQHVVLSEVESAGSASSNNLEIKESSYTLIDACDLTGSGAVGENGVEIYDGPNHPTVGNVVRGCWIHGAGGSGVASFGTVGTIVDGNTIEGANTAGVYATNSEQVPANSGGTLVISKNVIRGTLTTGGGAGIYVTNAFGGTGPKEVTISGNTVTTSAGTIAGIQVQGTATRFTIAHNVSTFNGGHGIIVISGHASVVGNIVTNNSQAGVALRNGIDIESGAPDAEVIGNECSDTQGSPTQQFGVYTAGSNASVIGNRAFGTANLGFYDPGSGTVKFGNRMDAGGFSLPNVTQTANVGTSVTVTYSASMTPNLWNGNTHVITATNGTAFTINDPSNPTVGERWTLTVKNTSGGALGAATFGAHYKMATWTNPANTNSRSIDFVYDGTNNIEVSRTPADVPN